MRITPYVPGMKPERVGWRSLVGATVILAVALTLSVGRVSYRPVRGC